MAAIGMMIHRRAIVTTVCYVALAICPQHGYHWGCLTHGDTGTEHWPLQLMGAALHHTNLHIHEDQN